jgi:hypothetical protein
MRSACSVWLKSLCFSNTYIFVVILYIMTSPASLRLSSRLHQFKCCNMSSTLDVFRCLLLTNLAAVRWTISSWSISPLSYFAANTSQRTRPKIFRIVFNVVFSYIDTTRAVFQSLGIAQVFSDLWKNIVKIGAILLISSLSNFRV